MNKEQENALIKCCEENKIYPVVIGTVDKLGQVVSMVNGHPKEVVQIIELMLKKHRTKVSQ